MAKTDPIIGRYVYIPYAGKEYRVYYEENGQGIPLVCLHTAGTDGREYRHQLCDPDITKNFRVIAFDLPRHGKSIPPKHFYKEEEEYALTSKFYSEFIMAFCEALELEKPIIMGSSMGGNVCLPLALEYENELTALIAIEACDHSPGWWIDPLNHPHIHGGEVCATAVFGLMAPQNPDEYRWETWWYYAQGGPGVFKGDLHFYSVDHDFRDLCRKILGPHSDRDADGRVRLRLHPGNDRADGRQDPQRGMHHHEGDRAFPDVREPRGVQEISDACARPSARLCAGSASGGVRSSSAARGDARARAVTALVNRMGRARGPEMWRVA